MGLSIVPLKEWGLPMKDIFLSAGPCSAESEEQVMDTARGLADCGVGFFRAGIWKPRTHPGSFEGVGIKGLKWLARVKDEFNLPTGVEVANPGHVEACLKHNIDVLWIGARTTPNPFAIQALADALKGTDIPVLIKNPISPDLELWIGAINRFYNAGLRKLAVIHRGFSTVRKIMYRNAPDWKIPIEFKRQFPNIPMLCDPSHISGNSEFIFSIAQEALDLLYDGLMIEVHVNPAAALSDSSQQITPDQYRSLIDRLIIKKEISSSQEYQTRIRELRLEVDNIDENIIELLGKRMEIAKKMGELKRRNNISTLQPNRWEEIVQSRIAAGSEQDLSEDFIFQLFQTIHEEAIQQQERDSNQEFKKE
ncbi:MAG: bifunctional 3-deoxy-7-phosphoheptulonate synthase/chorismate mutase type II [Nitrospirae bacterium]|nr:bifunctional 3-deoxy-7-phosphoheptulonate synthase/chorismate mutase type II [Nitrospirota bacterium]